MKVSEYIQQLEALRAEHGDLDVEAYFQNGDRVPARPPSVKHVKILKGRERKPVFWYSWEGEDCKGPAVICV